MTTDPTPVADELAAMRRIVAVLERLDVGTQVRVVAWVWERFMGVPHAAGEVARGE
jgi:hypothetical protein